MARQLPPTPEQRVVISISVSVSVHSQPGAPSPVRSRSIVSFCDAGAFAVVRIIVRAAASTSKSRERKGTKKTFARPSVTWELAHWSMVSMCTFMRPNCNESLPSPLRLVHSSRNLNLHAAVGIFYCRTLTSATAKKHPSCLRLSP